MITVESRRWGKTADAISRLPDDPKKPIVWIVYNEDFIEFVENLVRDIKGEGYMEHITVVDRQHSSKYQGTIHFDPLLYDYLGNGNV